MYATEILPPFGRLNDKILEFITECKTDYLAICLYIIHSFGERTVEVNTYSHATECNFYTGANTCFKSIACIKNISLATITPFYI